MRQTVHKMKVSRYSESVRQNERWHAHVGAIDTVPTYVVFKKTLRKPELAARPGAELDGVRAERTVSGCE